MRTKDKRRYKRYICFLLLLFFTVGTTGKGMAIGTEEKPKEIYLTFDDGPSYRVTNKILDVLKEKNVKATFFVVGYKIRGRETMIQRMQKEGHAIGVHSYTHNMKRLYRSEEVLLTEMDQTAQEIKAITGIAPSAMRLPGGSKGRLNRQLVERIHAKRYKMYDWNACISDGINYRTPAEKLYRESTKIIGNKSRVFLLLHCDQQNKNTYIALPRIIDFYKEKGYTFKAITEDTPELYFRVK